MEKISRRESVLKLLRHAAFFSSGMFVDRGGICENLTTAGIADNEQAATVTLMAVGDIMAHTPMMSAAYDARKKEYNFLPFFEYVRPVFKKADWVIGNLETRLAGKNAQIRTSEGVTSGYTGAPLFNAPEALAENLKDAGFALLSTANNHALDRYEEGIIRTNETLDRAGLLHTGTFISEEDRERDRILIRRGIRLAVFAYTYGTNFIRIPAGKEYLVNVIDLDRIAGDFARAKEQNVDFVACCLHFGNEYERFPGKEQIELVDSLFTLGADIIIGSHPHVLQPLEIRESSENPRNRKVVIYSLGNFISNQHDTYTDLGAILSLTLAKNQRGEAWISDIAAIPTRLIRFRTQKGLTYRVLPIREILETNACPELFASMKKTLERQLEYCERHLYSR